MITVDLLMLPGLRHGFFTREAGVSTGLYRGLNCGLGSNDDPAAVRRNREHVAETLGFPAGALATVHQIHSAEVVAVTEPWAAETAPRADAMVTDRPGVVLGVLSADCVPILFADAEARVIGAAHAGWKGALGGVLDATVEAMMGLGAKLPRLRAGIGPAIQQSSYEVGPEFVERFLDEDGANARFAKPSARAGHFMFDLPGYVEHRLHRLGLETVDRSHHDTASEETLFYSYRRATLRGEPDYGRGISAIALA
ncbi:MAG TPA: peptidoglycan editing factor PgeF [Stellaceae bacterium]|nr:peptidoglycan editing factor PgeF [Stellaceae bacterium]